VLPANYVPLTTKQREVLQRDFEEGKLRKVIATGCWGEGVDFVYLDVLCNASGSASPIDIVQWSGRNSRMHDGKLFGLVLDFNDAWDKWTLQRTKSRLSIYRKYQWELISATLTGSATHSS
jgi:ERCC4-related helicase